MHGVFDYISHAIWPLTFLAVALFGLNRMRATIEPVVRAMMTALAKQAQDQAGMWMVAGMFGLSASLSAFYDIFSQVNKADFEGMSGWQLAALLAKVANPFIIAALAYAMPPKTPPKSQPEQPAPSP